MNNSLHVEVVLPAFSSKEHKASVREQARRQLAYNLLDHLDECKSRVCLEIKEETFKKEMDDGSGVLANVFGDAYRIWVEINEVNTAHVYHTFSESIIPYHLYHNIDADETLFAKLDHYIRKVNKARREHWGG